MVYVIGDLHLSFGVDKPMDIFGYKWDRHTEKLSENWKEQVKEDDTVIIAGDFSWASNLEQAYKDFQFINELPGKKIILKGNHDYWWSTVTKMTNYLEENNFKNISFLYNNSYEFEDFEIVGTKGWSDQEITGFEKNVLREIGRLKNSIKSTKTDKPKIAVLHHPPFFIGEKEEYKFTNVLEEYDVSKCYYGHLHGESHKTAIQGIRNGIEYHLISGDYLDFKLMRIEL